MTDRKAGYSASCRGSDHVLCRSIGGACTCVCHGFPVATPRPARKPAAKPKARKPKIEPGEARVREEQSGCSIDVAPPSPGPSPAERAAAIAAERDRVLAAVREHGPITLPDLADRFGPTQTCSLHWHLLILGDRGLVEWSLRLDEPRRVRVVAS